MSKNRAFISVVIPFYNASKTIRECIYSLLNQDYPKNLYEIIVVDDGSTDNSYEIVERIIAKFNKPTIRLIRLNRRCGPSMSRNIGIMQAKGDIVALTDADCIVDKKWLLNITKPLKNSKDVVGAYGETKPLESGIGIIMWPILIAPITIFKYTTCNIAYKKTVLEAVGLFDERFKVPFREDTDIALSIIKNGGSIVHVPDAVVYHPIRELSLIGLISAAWRYQYDALLFKKHGSDIKSVMGVIGPIVSKVPLSPIGLFFLSALILLGLISIYRGILATSCLMLYCILSYMIIFILFLYRLFLLYGSRAPIRLRFKCSLAILLYLLIIIIARIYGSIKFRSFFI